MHLRSATLEDAEAISRLYNHSVLHSTATYHVVPESVEDRRQWLRDHDPATHPVLIMEKDGVMAGWASLSPFHPRLNPFNVRG
jgi:L-amino acid N-acyltransferase YncA